MRCKIAFKNSVSWDLKKTSRVNADGLFINIRRELPKKADTFPSLSGKFSGLRVLRVEDFKVIYTIIEDTARIVRISHRRKLHK